MRKHIVVAALAGAVLFVPGAQATQAQASRPAAIVVTAKAKPHHRRGCHTRLCDHRIDVAWASKHRAGTAGGSITSIITQAALRFGQAPSDAIRVATCESGLDPSQNNSGGAEGLFQFMPGTWATTPYASMSIFNAWASANAAMWMWSHGRRGEWVCQ